MREDIAFNVSTRDESDRIQLKVPPLARYREAIFSICSGIFLFRQRIATHQRRALTSCNAL